MIDKKSIIVSTIIGIFIIAAIVAARVWMNPTKVGATLREIAPWSQKISLCSPIWDVEGRAIYLISYKDTNWDGKYNERDCGVLVKIIEVSDKGKIELTKEPWNVTKLIGVRDNLIYFLGKKNGKEGIWSISTEESDPKLIKEGQFVAASFSPDGQYIAYTSKDELWIMKSDGTDFGNLTKPLGDKIKCYGKPIWSPDGMYLLCVLYHPARYIADEQSPYVLEPKLQMKFPLKFSLPPPWKIEIWRFDIGRIEITKLLTNPKDYLQRLTSPTYYAHSPSWKADGKEIAYVVTKFDSQKRIWQDIYTMKFDGTEQQNWTENMDKCFTPVWGTGKNSEQIAFVATSNLGTNLWLINTHYDKPKDLKNRITFNQQVIESPVWAPQGDKLLITVQEEEEILSVKLIILNPEKEHNKTRQP